MCRLSFAFLAVHVLLPVFVFAQDEAQPAGKPDLVLFDFETGDFKGWTRQGGDAFGPRPVDPDAEMWHRLAPHQQSYRFSGWQGRFLATNNMWLSEKHSWARPFRIPTGSIVSDEFVISRAYLKFLLAGTLNPGTGVRLRVENRIVRTAYGNNSFDLRTRGWDVKDLAGKRARLELFIETKAQERVLLRADFFHLSDIPLRPEAISRPLHPRDNQVLRAGEYRHVLDSSSAGSGAFGSAVAVQGLDGKWHLYTEEHKAAGTTVDGWYKERNDTFYHATAPSPEGPWSPLEPVMKKDPTSGEEYLWKPAVVVHGGKYYMFYLASGKPRAEGKYEGETGVHMATSPDGIAWTRHSRKPLFSESPEIGGISVNRVGDRWVMFYTAFSAISPSHKYPAMALFYRVSTNLVDWGRWNVAMHPQGDAAGMGEGQIVVFRHEDAWYLVGRRLMTQYGRTRFLFSEIWKTADPFHWEFDRGSLGLIDAWGSSPILAGERGLFLLHMHDDSRGAWVAPIVR